MLDVVDAGALPLAGFAGCGASSLSEAFAARRRVPQPDLADPLIPTAALRSFAETRAGTLELAEIEDLIREAVDEYPGYRSFRCFIPLLDYELGREAPARRAFDELAREDFAALPRDSEWLFCLSILSDVAVYLNDRDSAAVLYRLLLPYAEVNVLAAGEVAIGPVERFLGILAATTGRDDEAAGHFQNAIAITARMDARPGSPTPSTSTPACCSRATSRATGRAHTSCSKSASRPIVTLGWISGLTWRLRWGSGLACEPS